MLETKIIYKKKTLLTKNLTYNNKTILMSILHEYMFTSAGCLESPRGYHCTPVCCLSLYIILLI